MQRIGDLTFKEFRNTELKVGDYIWVSSSCFEDYDFNDSYIPVLKLEDNKLVDSLGRDRTIEYLEEEIDCVKLDMSNEMLNYFQSGGKISTDDSSCELFSRECHPGDLVIFSLYAYELDAVSYGICVGYNEIFNGSVILKDSIGYIYKLDLLTNYEKEVCEHLYVSYSNYASIYSLERPKVIGIGDTYFKEYGDSLELYICIAKKGDENIFLALYSEEYYILDYINGLCNHNLYNIDLLNYMLESNKGLLTKKKNGFKGINVKYLGNYTLIDNGVPINQVHNLSKELKKYKKYLFNVLRDEKLLALQGLKEQKEKEYKKLKWKYSKRLKDLQNQLNDEVDDKIKVSLQNQIQSLRTDERIENTDIKNKYIFMSNDIHTKYNIKKDNILNDFNLNVEKIILYIKGDVSCLSHIDTAYIKIMKMIITH